MRIEEVKGMTDETIQGLIDFNSRWLNHHNTSAEVYRKDLTMLYDEKHARMKHVDMKCSQCDERKPDVIMRPDPYAQEIHDDETEHLLCDDCSNENAMDI